jgi:Family of unknown function (DUF6521)
MMNFMTEWSARSPVPASLLNPALIAAILAAAASGYDREAHSALPWPLSFVIAPLVLHRATREALPSSVSTYLGVWVSRQPVLRAGLPQRAQGLVSPVREGMRFGLRHGLLAIDAAGGLRQAVSSLQPPEAGDLRAIMTKATFVGRWVSRSDQPATVFALLGVTV